MHEFQAQTKGTCAMVDARVYQQLCSSGANVEAAWLRALMLSTLDKIMPGWMENHDTDAVIKIAAHFPMKTMKVGVVYDQLPFNLQEFLNRIKTS